MPMDASDHHSKAVASLMRGRFCFLGEPRFSELRAMVRRGGEMKASKLTDVFTLADFRTIHGDDAMILFQHTPEKGLQPVHADAEKIEGFVTIYSLVVEKEDLETKALRKKEESEGKP
ncbi:MAG: CBS-domain-containing membrane protein [Akkermansiaceae bacterium]|jgi:CBS-domain-containing membrane protein